MFHKPRLVIGTVGYWKLSRTRQASLSGLPELGVGESGQPGDAGPGQRVQVERGVQGAEVLHRQPQDGQLVRPLRTVSVNIV